MRYVLTTTSRDLPEGFDKKNFWLWAMPVTKNGSVVTKKAIESVLTGEISSHTHAGGGGGSGDMLASTYDPGSVEGDAFDMDNMVEGTDTKILTSVERTKLSNTSGTNTGDQSSGDFDHDSLTNTHNLTTDIDHTAISNIGTNTHAQIDTHIGSTSNPHSVDKEDVGLSNVPNTDATARANHTGTQTLSTISDAGTGAAVNIHVGTSAPGSPSAGDLWIDTN
jgi:hypothetical protein